MELSAIIGILAIIVCIGFAAIVISLIDSFFTDESDWTIETPQRSFGRKGEEKAVNIIKSVLNEDDKLFTNVQLSYNEDGTEKNAECDNIIVNKNGVFIIEVKTYKGRIVGSENDYEWTKYHTTDAGNTYSKQVKNPIKQVKRQIYILSKCFNYYGIKVWIDGYAILLYDNSPIESQYILADDEEIDRVIHTPGRQKLSKQTIEKINNLLSCGSEINNLIH